MAYLTYDDAAVLATQHKARCICGHPKWMHRWWPVGCKYWRAGEGVDGCKCTRFISDVAPRG